MKHRNKVGSFLLCIAIFLSFLPTHIGASPADTAGSDVRAKGDEVIESYPDTSWTPTEILCEETAEGPASEFDEILSHLAAHEETHKRLTVPATDKLRVSTNAEVILQRLVARDDFYIEGAVSAEGVWRDLNRQYDFSAYSRYDIAEWAYVCGLITEAQKIEVFCDLIQSRNFQHIQCLLGVFDQLRSYVRDEAEIDEALLAKINGLLQAPDEPAFQTRAQGKAPASISNKAKYSNDYFTIHYDSAHNTQAEAKAVADYFVEVRNTFIALGFRTPILQLFRSTYHVYLDPEASGDDAAAVCRGKFTLTNTCASDIIIYSFVSLDDYMKTLVAHEYFHAIQNAYNWQAGWFCEATANWAKIIITQTPLFFEDSVNDFINTPQSMPETAGYGAVVFPLTIQIKYGGIGAIVAIYEEYNEYSALASLATLRMLITDSITQRGYDGGFDMAYRSMAAYNTDPERWYGNFHEDVSKWKNTSIIPLSVEAQTPVTGTLDYLSNQNFQILVPPNQIGTVTLEIIFSGNLGTVQTYRRSISEDIFITYYTTPSDNRVYAQRTGVGGGSAVYYGFILSNVANSGSITYTVNVSYQLTTETIFLAQHEPYVERVASIPPGGYIIYHITTEGAADMVAQTFGGKDTVLGLYTMVGGIPVADSDDEGYELNALFQWQSAADTSYILRVEFYNPAQSGQYRLAFTPATELLQAGSVAINQYEDILLLSNAWSHNVSMLNEIYETKLLRFLPEEYGGLYVFEIFSDIDTMIYVIDPASSAPAQDCYEYRKIGGTGANGRLVKEVWDDIPYLIIVTAERLGVPQDANQWLTLSVGQY
ncbi:MAG: hypothetical protein WDA00_07025 [Eubacteriales bacterium]